MEKSSWSHFISHPLFLILYLDIIFFRNVTMAQTTPTQVRVGVVLDLENNVGQMGLNTISMALSDFYATNGSNYQTRIALSVRDSKRNAVGAAATTLDLLKNVEVQAIIGPLLSSQASFMIDLGDEAQVPIITFSATSPSLSSLRSPYFIRATLNDSSQVQAISAIIKSFGWREIVPIYVDNEFGEGIIPYLTDALEQVNTRVPYRSIIPSLATDDQIVSELYKLMSMQTRVFVVHVLSSLGSRLFTKAKQLGMMSEEYAWIITDAMTNALNLVEPSVVDSMLGVIGLRPYIPETNELDQFKNRYKRRLQQTNSTALSPDINMFGLWAYDSATALAMAVEQANLTNARFQQSNISGNSTDLEGFGVSSQGPNLIQALSSTTFKGLTGDFRLVFGELQSPPYEIVNVVGLSARGIGYWTKENGIVKELNFSNTNSNNYSTSKSSFRSIIWPGDTTAPPKGWVVPTNGRKLRIGVPVKNGFTEFVRVTWNSDNSTKVEGYCIDVFDAVMAAMPYGVPYEYVPFSNSEHNPAGSYNDLTYQVKLGNYDAVVGDVAIVANRSQYVDFTLPFTQSAVSMVAPIQDNMSKNALVFFKPLTFKMWMTSLCSFIFIGILIWILEHRINNELRVTTWHQVGRVFWFAFSTLVFAQKEKVESNLSRLVLVVWFLVVLIITQSYNANLTTMLTVQQLQPTVTDINRLISNKEYVGYQVGSFVFGKLQKLNFDESRLLSYNSAEEMHELFLKGSGNGGIAAAFDEIPYIKLFIGKYCSKYAMVDPTYKTDGFGFVFPVGSPLVPDISRAILNVTESEKKIEEIERTWFGGKTKCEDSDSPRSPNSFGLESFWVLFTIIGGFAAIALVIFFGKFMYENWDVVVHPALSVRQAIVELFKRFLAEDPNAPDFRVVNVAPLLALPAAVPAAPLLALPAAVPVAPLPVLPESAVPVPPLPASAEAVALAPNHDQVHVPEIQEIPQEAVPGDQNQEIGVANPNHNHLPAGIELVGPRN